VQAELQRDAALDAADVLRRKLEFEIRHRATVEWELGNSRRIYQGLLDDQLRIKRGLTEQLNAALRERDELRAQLAIRDQDDEEDLELYGGRQARPQQGAH